MTTVAVSGLAQIGNQEAPFIGMLKREGFEIKLINDDRFSHGHASDEKEVELLQGVSAVIAGGERYPRKVIESLPELRSIARLGVGFDRVDVQAATANDVVLTITPNSNHEAVAEQAFALIMAVAKSIVIRDKAMRTGEWPRQPLMPIRGAVLGIVGLGRIGRDLAARALAMKMNVLAAEPQPDMDFVNENGIQLLELDALLKNSDYVSLNCALSEKTRGLIDRHKLALMKPEAVLINTGRGELIVESDLIEALKSGQIGGAGLDVFELEPTGPDNQLYTMDNVVVSPHVAGVDVLSVEDMGKEAAQCVIDLFKGRWPNGAVINNELKGKWNW